MGERECVAGEGGEGERRRQRTRLRPRLLLELPRLGVRAPWETRQAAGVPSSGRHFPAKFPTRLATPLGTPLSAFLAPVAADICLASYSSACITSEKHIAVQQFSSFVSKSVNGGSEESGGINIRGF